MLFSIWDERNMCLSWDATVEYADLLNIDIVPILYRGIWNEELIKKIKVDTKKSEGYVIRIAGEFHYSQFRTHVAKFVRKHHIRSHGLHQRRTLIKNNLKK